jgi:hypothetical protein
MRSKSIIKDIISFVIEEFSFTLIFDSERISSYGVSESSSFFLASDLVAINFLL